MHTDAALGKLEALAGVEGSFSYPMSHTGAVGHAFGHTAPLGLWSTVFESRGAAEIGRITGGVTPGAAFITEHRVGDGKLVMLGSMPQGDEGIAMLQAMLNHYAMDSEISLRAESSQGTIVAPRFNEQGKVWIVINMDGKGGWVKLQQKSKDAFSGEIIDAGTLELQPYTYRVLLLQG